MKPKPAFLGPEFGSQFADPAVAEAYGARPAYARALFPFLAGLTVGPGAVLELGSGTGNLTLGLAPYVDRIEAVEPSEAMLSIARNRASQAESDRIRWHHTEAEAFEFESGYSMVVAAASLHWMEWSVVLPRIWESLAPGGVLAVVDGRRGFPAELRTGLQALVSEFSTNTGYEPYDLIVELTDRGLFFEVDRREFRTKIVRSGAQIVEWYHSQNGFSRDRMSPEAGRAFDAALLDLVATPHSSDGVPIEMTNRVMWGRGTG